MKVKQIPADFVVEERTRLRPSDQGPHALYHLHKQGIGTLEALRAVRRAWRVPARDVGFGGLKDRHAMTVQVLTIRGGPRRNLEDRAFRLTYEGRCEEPMSRMALEGNGFRVRLRDLSAEEADTLATRWADLVESGAPAYFDDQRFGSLRGGGGFAALHLLRGDAEAALRAVIASPSREDRAPVRERKRRLAAVWGDWDAALAEVAGTPTRGALLHLRTHPRDFEGAFARLDRDEKRLFASAYASAVWNRAVVARIEALVPPDDRIVLRGAAGPLVFPKAPRALDAWREDVLPLPAPGATASDPAWQEALEAALAEDGLALDRLALAPSLAMPLRPTKRRVLFGPQEPRLEAPLPDDLNAGRFALALAFALGPGLYATILLKRLAWDLGGPKAFS